MRPKKAFTLNLLRKIFFIAIILSLAYVSIPIFLKKNYSFEDDLSKPPSSSKEPQKYSPESKRDYQRFLREIATRAIFALSAPEKKPPRTTGIEEDKISKIIESLKLVGIISTDTKRAMIEDTKTQKSFYLKEGESFLENIIVEEIKKDSVILNCYGREFELYL
ncbi:MAG: hypothetical protein JSW40_01590 [Candidatus Omnitrophota bacterium]|nr:MAG: hypothetical protein JSW40_01590 [Candidatus Omnitrophota bacterium]